MRTPIALLALLPMWSIAQEEEAAAPVAEPTGNLMLTDGVVLSGEPEGSDDQGKLKWRVSSLIDPVSVARSSIVGMNLLRDDAQPRPRDTHEAMIRLTNGDTLRGQLKALTETHVTVKTSYGATLNLQRTMVWEIEIQPPNTLYSGPRNLEEWTVTGDGDAWQVVSGALHASKGASIARQIETPAKCRISFDLHWPTSLRGRVLLFSNDGTTAIPDNCYDLVCQRQFVHLRHRWQTDEEGGNTILGRGEIAVLGERKEHARFDIYHDRETGTTALYVNGVREGVWTDELPQAETLGNWFHIVSEDFFPIQVSRIRMFPWDGELPAGAEQDDLPEDDPTLDFIRLQDHTVVAGKVRGIEKELLKFTSATGEADLPIAKIGTIQLSRDKYDEPVRKKGDVRAWTRDGGRLTFRLHSFGTDTLTGHSQIYGNAEFNLSSFTRVDFNIYDEQLDKLRDAHRNR